MYALRTIILMGVMGVLMLLAGYALGGERGMIVAFVFAMATNFFGYWFSDKMAIAMAGAQPVSEQEAPELYAIVQGLCTKAGLPMPRIYIAPDESPNAFATGRDPEHSAVAVTAGILRILNRTELEAVLAHELGHVKNRDILITTIGSVMASVITMIAHYGVYFVGGRRDDGEEGINPIMAILMMIAAPIAATLVNLAISRTREFDADKTGAEICGHPEALASALAKLEQVNNRMYSNVNPALGNMYTVRPDRGNWITNMLSTHPPIPERIARLEEMEATTRSPF